MVSDRDFQAVKKTIPEYIGRIEVIPNGVDLETHNLGTPEPVPNSIIFNGSLTYYANLDAMKFFIQEVLPLIRQDNPDVRLKVTGKTGGVDLSVLSLDEGITLTGYLEDVRPAVAASSVAVAPSAVVAVRV